MTEVALRLLGEVTVLVDGDPVDVGGRQPQIVLAALGLRVSEICSMDYLAAALWDQQTPERSERNISSIVSRLRTRMLDATSDELALVTRTGAGYRLEITPEQVDTHQFLVAHATARAALSEDEFAGALEAADVALALWRGRPLGGLSCASLESGVNGLKLSERRMREVRADALLRLGRLDESIAAARDLMGRFPLSELAAGVLMQGLYSSGQQSEALGVYQDIRKRLVEEAGLEPTPTLQRIHRAILNHDLTITSADTASTALSSGGAFVEVLASQWAHGPVPLQARSVTIGRASSCDLCLDWDDEVSRTHALLECVGATWTVVDDGLSRNGTFVNSERVEGRRRLIDGDQIRLGRTMLAFHSEMLPEDETAVATT